MTSENFRTAFKSAIARIYHSNGAVVGAGFLVSERQLLTCAHVVTAALGIPITTAEAPTTSLELDFPLITPGQKMTAKVVFWQPVNPSKSGEDIAGLELETAAPVGSQAVRLVQSDEFWNHPFQIFGFPSGRDAGVWAAGVLRDRLANGWVQMEDIKAPGYAVQPGFSGAPVWDEQLQGVVGMAVAAEKKREEAKAAFMIPVSVLASSWVDLRQKVAQAQPQTNRVAQQSFRQVKLRAKQEQWNSLVDQWKAALNQKNYALSSVDAIKLGKQLEMLEQEINAVERELKELDD